MSDALAEQFTTHPQRRTADMLGMWIFLASETMMFGALFFVFLAYRAGAGYGAGTASRNFDMWSGGLNTAVLLTSSLAMALAVIAAREERQRAAMVRLIITMILGALFLGLKIHEWTREWTEGIRPHIGPTEGPSGQQLFFNFYFVATGLHAVHLIVGILLVGGLTIKVARHTAQEMTVTAVGLYWHFVDVVWVFLYPVLYLVGR